MDALDLRTVINKIVPLEEQAWRAMEEYLSILPLKKFEHLWKIGDLCRHLVFIKKGIIRNYYFNDDKQITLRFFKDQSMVVSYKSFITQTPTQIAFEALEDTELIIIPRAGIYDLYDKFKTFDRLGRVMAEKSFVEIQNLRVESALTPEEKYLKLLRNEPELLDRVSQQHISSYLGMTPEHLSRVRKKIMTRKV